MYAVDHIFHTTAATTNDFALNSVLDHPSAWLEVIDILPCLDANNVCFTAKAEQLELTLSAINVEQPTHGGEGHLAFRAFGLCLTDGKGSLGARMEFKVHATADSVNVALTLLSADEALLNNSAMATCLGLGMGSLVSNAYHLICEFHRNLSSDLADTIVTCSLEVPGKAYRDIVSLAVGEFESFVAYALVNGKLAIQPQCITRFADTSIVENALPEVARVPLNVTQRLALALNLNEIREAKGLTQLELAHQALGFVKSHAAISRLERGILAEVDLERLEKIAEFFGIEVSALLENRKASGESNLDGEDHGLSIFDKDCDFTPSALFGNRIALARRSAGLSQDALGKALGHISGATVGQWENEDMQPRRTSFIDIGIALDCPASWLMFGRRVETPTRAIALRLTAMQKLYSLTNGEVASLMSRTSDTEQLLDDGIFVSRLTLGHKSKNQQKLNRIARVFQVPLEWLQPPEEGALRDDSYGTRRTSELSSKHSAMTTKLSSMSNPAKRLVADLVDLMALGVISDVEINNLRRSLVHQFTTPVIKGRVALPA